MPRISDLATIGVPAENDTIPIVDESAVETKKVSIGQITPVGMVVDFAGTSAPAGWLLCFGQALNAVTSPEYQALFTSIGNSYGGTNNTDFVVPDLRGRVIAGKDNMGGTSANRLNDIAGSLDGDVIGDAGGLESTKHASMKTPVNSSSFQDAGSAYLTSMVTDINSYLTGGGSSALSESVAVRSVGGTVRTTGTSPTEVGHYRYTAPNIQPTIILNKIIRY
jgi:microcystin-dependent protein